MSNQRQRAGARPALLVILLMSGYSSPGAPSGSQGIDAVLPRDDHSPCWSPDGAHIFFGSDREGRAGDIYVISAGGGPEHRLTCHEATDVAADVSPDGSKIVFNTDRDGNSEIYVMNVDGSNPINLTNNPADDHDPSWSRDGTRISFGSNRGGGSGDVYIMDVDGGNVTRLTQSIGWSFPTTQAWSPDDRQIVFGSTGEVPYDDSRPGFEKYRDFEVFIVDVESLVIRQLTHNNLEDSYPTWSPDGTSIGFSHYNFQSGTYDVYTVSIDGSNTTRLTDHPAHQYHSAWSPDGSKLAFHSKELGEGRIFIMNRDGSGKRQLTR